MDAAAGLEAAQGGERERLRAEVGGEMPDGTRDDGQADAVDRDARADRKRLDVEIRDHNQAHHRRLIELYAPDRFDDAERFDDAREHVPKPRKAAPIIASSSEGMGPPPSPPNLPRQCCGGRAAFAPTR